MILVSMRTQSAITLVNKPVQIIVIIHQLLTIRYQLTDTIFLQNIYTFDIKFYYHFP